MEPWALPAWPSWTPGQGSEPGGATPSIADTPAALLGGEQRPEESSEPEGAQSPGATGGIDPEGTKTGLPSLRHQAASSRPSCPRLEDEEVEAFPKVRELGRAGVYVVGPLMMPSSLGITCDAPRLLSWPVSVWGSFSVTVCHAFSGQESQGLHFLPYVCPSDSLPVCTSGPAPTPSLCQSLSDGLSVSPPLRVSVLGGWRIPGGGGGGDSGGVWWNRS